MYSRELLLFVILFLNIVLLYIALSKFIRRVYNATHVRSAYAEIPYLSSEGYHLV